ncbi:hypothetical protein GCM10010387_07110 [Streptomyces inusitatus]|uniref:Uncharacterized protein n=1 Tax=Streptomyces inusitatus TaxID=68221 RepID=A0A918PNC4_9ACTN|nr:hypothetical protein GCM10010387_07110 [Streptomyces inusitatus]
MIRNHIKEFGSADDGRLFRTSRGGHLLSKEYGDLWRRLKASSHQAMTHEGTALSPGAAPFQFVVSTGSEGWLV